jgi:hypothetical protein
MTQPSLATCLPPHRHPQGWPRTVARRRRHVAPGEWDMSVQQRIAFIEQCIALGVTSFDHADIYGNYGVEGLFGEALRASPRCATAWKSSASAASSWSRQQTPRSTRSSTTTRAPRTSSPPRGIAAPAAHRPPRPAADPPPRSADGLRRDRRSVHPPQAAGKVRHVGVSNFTPPPVRGAEPPRAAGDEPGGILALYTAPMFDETFDGLQDLGIAPMIWSPLGGGRLFTRTMRTPKPAPRDPGSRRPPAPAVRQRGLRLDHAAAEPADAADRQRQDRLGCRGGGRHHASRSSAATGSRSCARRAATRSHKPDTMAEPLKIVEGRALTAQQKKDLLNRLARIEGQLRGVQKLIALADASRPTARPWPSRWRRRARRSTARSFNCSRPAS